jgi:hypothetical protein
MERYDSDQWMIAMVRFHGPLSYRIRRLAVVSFGGPYFSSVCSAAFFDIGG